MTRGLLDVNVLLALLDSGHVHHDRAHAWMDAEHAAGWASCAFTENGCVRILSQPRYPGRIAVTEAVALLGEATRSGLHAFWPCTVSLLDASAVDASRLLGSKQITDAYLLALAVQQDGRLVTFDQAVPLAAVPAATADHLVVL